MTLDTSEPRPAGGASSAAGRLSVVLFNLGGPDSLKSVRPFLFNLFNDRAIIGLPQPVRWGLAQLISRIRAPTALEIYRTMGGRSPLLEETEAQRAALEAELRLRGIAAQVVIAMRYWRPFTRDAARAVARHAPDRVVLLPLYPQFSTTTTGSSLGAWRRAWKGSCPVSAVCCYPEAPGFIESHSERILSLLGGRPASDFRVVFSAHGLPERVVLAGDPYQKQVERTSARIAEALGLPDWVVSYQSRVGPLKWIGPSTVEVIEAAGREGRALLVVPIAFVSEHSETLVELDIEYAELAHEVGVPEYLRAPAIGAEPPYIEALADMCVAAAAGPPCAGPAGTPCGDFAKCPRRREATP